MSEIITVRVEFCSSTLKGRECKLLAGHPGEHTRGIWSWTTEEGYAHPYKRSRR